MLGWEDYGAIHTVYPSIDDYVVRAARFENITCLNGFNCIYSDLMYYMTCKNYGQGRCATNLGKLRENVSAFRKQAVNNVLPVYISGQLTLLFILLDHSIADDWKFVGSLSSMRHHSTNSTQNVNSLCSQV